MFRSMLVFASLFCFLTGPAIGGINDDLIAYYPFNGNADDASGHGNDGLAFGAAPTVDRFGSPNSAFRFDGVDDYVDISAIVDDVLASGNGQGAISLWFLADSDSLEASSFMVRVGNGYGPALIIGDHTQYSSSESLSWTMLCNNFFLLENGNSFLRDNAWHHVVIQMGDSFNESWLDGTKVGGRYFGSGSANTGSCMWPPEIDFAELGRLNRRNGITEAYHKGVLDDVRIYGRTLSAAEIEELFAATGTDADGDGFSPPQDCDESDPTVNPDGLELPGNFIDENCDGNLGDCDPCLQWRNHGEYVRCVAQAVEALVGSGDVTEEDGDDLVSNAARSDIGKKDYTPPECE